MHILFQMCSRPVHILFQMSYAIVMYCFRSEEGIFDIHGFSDSIAFERPSTLADY